MTDFSIATYLPEVETYLRRSEAVIVPNWSCQGSFTVTPLAQGEYNMNYLVQQGKTAWVLRINTGSQMNLSGQDQINYEYKTLQLLEPADVGPVPYFLDDSLHHLPFGILGMSYLPGEPLDYRRDLSAAARLFATYHQLQVDPHKNHLVHEEKPLTRTYDRCSHRLQVYLTAYRADPDLSVYLKEVLAWADQARLSEKYFLEDPWRCIINTEVNNTNWIVNRRTGTIHLVDWEKPLWGDPSQDLSHFRVPTTTLWKTDYRLTKQEQSAMMAAYKAALHDPHLRDTIEERTRLRDPFNCLKAVSWCAMVWVNYHQDDRILRNPDTFRRLSMYLSLDFVRDVFDPYLQAD